MDFYTDLTHRRRRWKTYIKSQWVRVKNAAPQSTVNALMNNDDRRTAVELVWKLCIKRVQGEQKIYELKS